MRKICIDKTWKDQLEDQFASQYMLDLSTYLRKEKILGKKIYPKGSLIFKALDATPFDQVRVVIIGQDPYHGIGQANGLSFSVPANIKNPPSLQNIFKELNSDLKVPISRSGDLEYWASQGVLLLNSCLTVEHGMPGSHKNLGWERFTDAVIHKLNSKKANLVFILWGALSRQKCKVIDRNKHFIIESAHPSPFSARNGFFGSKPFSRTNNYLQNVGMKGIDWRLRPY